MLGYNVKLLERPDRRRTERTEPEGRADHRRPLFPGCMQTVWGDDQRFVNTYWKSFGNRLGNTFDWAIRDEDGYYFILGRTDDVINGGRGWAPAKSRKPSVATGPSPRGGGGGRDRCPQRSGRPRLCRVNNPAVLRDEALRQRLEAEIMQTVDQQLGAVARPARVLFVRPYQNPIGQAIETRGASHL